MRIFEWLQSRISAKRGAVLDGREDPVAGPPPLPTPLSDLMARVLEQPSAETWDAFHDAFLRSPLGVIASGGAPGTGPGSVRLARGATPDGRVMVLACADRDAFAQRFHDRFNQEVLGRELARVALAMPRCEGILVNSAASFHSIGIDHEKLATLLQRFDD